MLAAKASSFEEPTIKFSKVNYYVKKHGFSTDATIEMIEEIVNDNDIVLTAIGDCGSCCSSCIREMRSH